MAAVTRFDARVALVTGAGSESGIGFAAAQVLAERGAVVAVTSTTDRIQARALELARDGVQAAGFVADLTVIDQAEGARGGGRGAVRPAGHRS